MGLGRVFARVVYLGVWEVWIWFARGDGRFGVKVPSEGELRMKFTTRVDERCLGKVP